MNISLTPHLSQTVGNYMIFYFPINDGIDIVRVLHGARDIRANFFVDDEVFR